MAGVSELTFQRATVHLVHDAQRLEDGKDLNDALLDFFVKLGQSLIPEGGGPPPVAYLGSHFYDVLRKGGVQDGKIGHKNVANWARRRLGAGGLFGEGIGALAVPVNEVLKDSYDGRADTSERHWWLALLLNPRAVGATKSCADKDVSLLCLDSFVRAETVYTPKVVSHKAGGSLKGYSTEVTSLSRQGFCVNVQFSAQGDGTRGPLAEPRKSVLKAGGQDFKNRELNLKVKELGGDGTPSYVDGTLGFRLDRRGAAKTGGEYILEYGDVGDNYQPVLRLRMGQKPTHFQSQVGKFLGGYLEKEQSVLLNGAKRPQATSGAAAIETEICLPGVPQQENGHDCGFFILEQILRSLQLSPEALRELAQASSVEIAMLPWPSQKQVARRKQKLREAMAALFAEARKLGNGDVEVMLKADPGLRARIRTALREGGSSFSKGYERWAAGDWDLSPSPSRSRSREQEVVAKPKGSRSRSQGTSRSVSSRRSRRKKKKKRKARHNSSDEESSGGRGRKRRRDEASDSRSEEEKKPATPAPVNLGTASVTQLRALCLKHAVMPAGSVEKSDLVRALTPFYGQTAATQPAPQVPGGAQALKPPRVSKFDMMTAPAPKTNNVTNIMGLKIEMPAKVPSGGAGKSFSRSGLEAMSNKELRNLCVQNKVLPAGPVERSELLQALAPLASG